MSDAPSPSKEPRPHRPEYEDPHYHDDDEIVHVDDSDHPGPRQPARRKPVRRPPAGRRYEED